MGGARVGRLRRKRQAMAAALRPRARQSHAHTLIFLVCFAQILRHFPSPSPDAPPEAVGTLLAPDARNKYAMNSRRFWVLCCPFLATLSHPVASCQFNSCDLYAPRNPPRLLLMLVDWFECTLPAIHTGACGSSFAVIACSCADRTRRLPCRRHLEKCDRQQIPRLCQWSHLVRCGRVLIVLWIFALHLLRGRPHSPISAWKRIMCRYTGIDHPLKDTHQGRAAVDAHYRN